MKYSMPAPPPHFVTLIAALLVALGGCGDAKVTSSLNNQADGGGTGSDAGSDAAFDTGADTNVGGDTGPGQDTGDVTDDPCLQTSPQDAASFAGDVTTALCEKILTCEQNAKLAQFVTFGGWTSVDHCVESLQAGLISPGRAQAAAQDGSLTLNSCEAADCLAEIPDFDCLGIHRALAEARFEGLSSCWDAWHGTRGDGQSCTVDGQCAGGRVCVRDANSPTCAGSCTDAGQSGSGQCGDIVCRADQYCQTENNVCFSRSGAGATCEADFECTLDTRCVGGTCTAISAGLGSGQACNVDDQLCNFQLACIDGSCTSFKAAGESCSGFGCEGGLFCNQSGVCEARKAGGTSCNDDQECVSLVCAGGSCAPLDQLCGG